MDKKLTIGQIKDKIAKQITQFYVEALGYGPKEVKTYILDDMVIVRLMGMLRLFDQKLLEKKEGLDLVKNGREMLHEIVSHDLRKIISDITGHTVKSSHSDFSTKTGEMFEVFILDNCYEAELDIN